MPKCGGGKKEALNNPNSESNITPQTFTMNCGNCNFSQSIVNNLSAFVCIDCHRVNRIIVKDPQTGGRRLSISDPALEEFRLVRTSSTTFAVEGGQDLAALKVNENTVPLCSVCMDGPGDMVLLPCAHGAICEACAQHISRNLSVGGSLCPKCRVEITQLVRLSELHPKKAKGVSVIIPADSRLKGPPKVPPPPGQHKAKSQ